MLGVEGEQSAAGAARRSREYLILCGVWVTTAVAILYYAVTRALSWDEGFHVIAAVSIRAGMRPYLDFCFPQTPLNAYWNAFWMGIFGESWRGVHAVAAVLTMGAVVMAADYVFVRFPIARWRVAAAVITTLLVTLNNEVFAFGPLAQAYGSCMFLCLAAFRVAANRDGRAGLARSCVTGLLIGAAAACSLLCAPACAVFAVWMMWRAGWARWWQAGAAFAGGVLVAFVPVILLFAAGPKQTWFNLVGYHVFFRHVRWEGATQHDWTVWTAWFDSGEALLMLGLAVAGLKFARRAELVLCALVAVSLSLEASVAHPTFTQYYVLTAPFLGIPAAWGAYFVAQRMQWERRRVLAVVVILILTVIGQARYQDARRMEYTWPQLEEIASGVKQVTAEGATLMAEPQIYFLLRRKAPSGMEFPASHKLDLPAPMAAELHVIPRLALQQKVWHGEFQTVQTCDEDTQEIKDLKLSEYFAHVATPADCETYWGFKGAR